MMKTYIQSRSDLIIFALSSVRVELLVNYFYLNYFSGYCYQFNSNGSAMSNAAGKAGGVQFILNTATDQYSTGPNSHAKGFSVRIMYMCV